MRQIFVNLHFWNCAATAVEDVVAWAKILQRHGAILLARRTLEPLPEERWLETFQKERYETKIFKSHIGHRIVFADLGGLEANFWFDEYHEGGNKLEVGTLLDFQFKDQRPLVEPLAQRLLTIARDLYPLARPMYGEVEGGMGRWDDRDVLRLRLKHISWVNFFGPAYVEKYGLDFFLGLPGYKTERLPDGGVFHQLSPTFVAPSEAEARRLRREVIAYCARHGLKVTCHAPFVIPGLTQRKPAPGLPKAEFEALLDYILTGATLVLKDGTRVRVLRIPWEELTEEQREQVLAAIRQAAVQAIKASGGARVRFEFNAVPDDLDALLLDLAGPENPWFEWVEVPDLA